MKWESRLVLLALSGQLLSYGLGILVARALGVDGFEAYVVASAVFILMVSFVPQGFDKYALALLPPLFKRGEWARLHGYWRFSSRRILIACLPVATVVAAITWSADGLSLQARIAITVSCLALPAGALVHLALEVLAAAGRAVAATVVFRVVVPGVALLLVCILLSFAPAMQAWWAVAAWGVSWCFALALMGGQLRRVFSASTRAVRPVEDAAAWASGARPFWIYRVSLAVLAQAGIVAMEAFQPSASAVGAFAAALGTAAMAQILATATNRVYGSKLSLLLDQGNIDGIQRLRMARLRWLAAPLLGYLLLVFAFAPMLLGLFHAEFVDEGTTALRILALSTALSTVLAMGPTYLKHRGENRPIMWIVAMAAILQFVLLVLLVPRYGTTGAALSYALANGFMYGWLARLAHLGLRNLRPRDG
ncbi:lipopolysaccharide biosynthesis protein [Luteimonas sp. A482]